METKSKLDELEELVRPIAEYLRENYHPHASIIITETSAKVVEDLMGTPIK